MGKCAAQGATLPARGPILSGRRRKVRTQADHCSPRVRDPRSLCHHRRRGFETEGEAPGSEPSGARGAGRDGESRRSRPQLHRARGRPAGRPGRRRRRLEGTPRAPPTRPAPRAGPGRCGGLSGRVPEHRRECEHGGAQQRLRIQERREDRAGCRRCRAAPARRRRAGQPEPRSHPDRAGGDHEPAPAERAQHRPFDRGAPRSREGRVERRPTTGPRAPERGRGSRPKEACVAMRIAGALSTPRTRARPGRPAAAEIAATVTPQRQSARSWATRRAPRGLADCSSSVGDGTATPCVQGPDHALEVASKLGQATDASPGPGRDRRRSPRRGGRGGPGGTRAGRATGFRSRVLSLPASGERPG